MASFRFLIALVGCGRISFDAAVDAEPGPVDSPPDVALAPLCDRVAGASYCSDFEGGALKGAGPQGTIPLLPGGGSNGSDAFTMTANPGSMPRIAFNLPAFVNMGELHVGGWFHLDAGPASPDYVVIAQAMSLTFEKISFDVGSFDRAQLVNTINSAGVRQGALASIPRGRWVCFELAIVVSPASDGQIKILLDGASVVAGFDTVITVPPGGFSRIEIGSFSSPMNTAAETIRFDNWIISTQAIGCP